VFCLVLSLILTGTLLSSGQAGNRKIAVFGSSVAKGSGDTTLAGGYAGLIRNMLEKRGWTVVNVSKGGDNTVKIMPRFETQLLPEKPAFVIIGLSLGNEGIAVSSEVTRNRIFEQFRCNMVHLIRLCREKGMYPVIVNCYARNDFQQEQYAAVKKMNLIMDTWDVPCMNSLGAIDNGKGNWADGYWHDKSHPNEKGHREIFYSFVPGLFDAILAGKKVPEKIRSNNYLSVFPDSGDEPLVYTPADTIHSFAVSFLVNPQGEGTVAGILDENSSASLVVRDGKISYSHNGKTVQGDELSDENKGWQYIVLTHQFASGSTSLYTNGRLAGTLNESIGLKEFILGGKGHAGEGPATVQAGFKDLLIYRSALNTDEVTALYADQLLPASLEIYAPLNDPEFRKGTLVNNLAQSMSELHVLGKHLVSSAEENEPPKK